MNGFCGRKKTLGGAGIWMRPVAEDQRPGGSTHVLIMTGHPNLMGSGCSVEACTPVYQANRAAVLSASTARGTQPMT